jgi:hypothetical protein
MKTRIILPTFCLMCSLLHAQTIVATAYEFGNKRAAMGHHLTPLPNATPYSVPVLFPIVPNPANDAVNIAWEQDTSLSVNLTVSDIAGSISIMLPLGEKEIGRHGKDFSTAALSEGWYMASLQVGNTVLSQQFLVKH